MCHLRLSRGWRKARVVESVGKPSSTCTWMDLGVKPQRIVSGFCSHWGRKVAYSPRSAWMCAPHRRSDLARKEFCVGRSLTSRPRGTFLAPTLRAPRTPYRLRNLDTNPTTGFQWRGFPSKIWTNSSSQVRMCDPKLLQSLFPHFQIVAPHPSCSLTSREHELPVVPSCHRALVCGLHSVG